MDLSVGLGTMRLRASGSGDADDAAHEGNVFELLIPEISENLCLTISLNSNTDFLVKNHVFASPYSATS